MAEQDVLRFRVCQDRLSCTGAYSYDYLKRIKKSREEQGTGNLVNDLRRRLEAREIDAEVIPINCYGWCSKSPVVTISGRLIAGVFFKNIDAAIDEGLNADTLNQASLEELQREMLKLKEQH